MIMWNTPFRCFESSGCWFLSRSLIRAVCRRSVLVLGLVCGQSLFHVDTLDWCPSDQCKQRALSFNFLLFVFPLANCLNAMLCNVISWYNEFTVHMIRYTVEVSYGDRPNTRISFMELHFMVLPLKVIKDPHVIEEDFHLMEWNFTVQ